MVYQCLYLPMFINMWIFLFPLILFLSFYSGLSCSSDVTCLFPRIILSVIVDFNGVFKTKYIHVYPHVWPSPFIQMQISFLTKRKRKIGIFTAKLTILCYDQNPTSLQSNGMAAIPKNALLCCMLTCTASFWSLEYAKWFKHPCVQNSNVRVPW